MGSGWTGVSDAIAVQVEIWIGTPAAGESAAMDHTFENDRLVCVCQPGDQITREAVLGSNHDIT